MSPRPTKSAGKRRRSPSASVRGSTYLPVATLPSSTASPPGPTSAATRAAPRRGGGWRRAASASARRGDRVHDGVDAPRVEHLAAAPPAAAGHRHAVADVAQLAGGVRVRRDDEPDGALPGGPEEAWLEVEPVRVAVDLDRRARLRDHVEDRLDVGLDRRAGEEQAAERVAPDLEARVPHG